MTPSINWVFATDIHLAHEIDRLEKEIEKLEAENAKLKNHVIGQDRIIADLEARKP